MVLQWSCEMNESVHGAISSWAVYVASTLFVCGMGDLWSDLRRQKLGLVEGSCGPGEYNYVLLCVDILDETTKSNKEFLLLPCYSPSSPSRQIRKCTLLNTTMKLVTVL